MRLIKLLLVIILFITFSCSQRKTELNISYKYQIVLNDTLIYNTIKKYILENKIINKHDFIKIDIYRSHFDRMIYLSSSSFDLYDVTFDEEFPSFYTFVDNRLVIITEGLGTIESKKYIEQELIKRKLFNKEEAIRTNHTATWVLTTSRNKNFNLVKTGDVPIPTLPLLPNEK